MRETMYRRMFGWGLAACLAAAALVARPALAQEPDHQHHFKAGMPTTDAGSVPLYENLGTLSHKVSTGSVAAQQFFDQGLRLTYAFNHEEAIASYTHATRVDSTCAM